MDNREPLPTMRPPRENKSRISPERLLLLVAFAVFLTGAVWLSHRSKCEVAGISRSWLGALPSLGLPLVYTLLRR
jgi:hypothetical protein